MPRKTDSNNPSDWLWIAAVDLTVIELAVSQESGFPTVRSKLAEVLEKTIKAELLRLGWRLEKTHDLILRLVEDGRLNGLRIDHPDGIYDPADYLRRLQDVRRRQLSGETPGENGDGRDPVGSAADSDEAARRPLYVVVEKILCADEQLPLRLHACRHSDPGRRRSTLCHLFVVLEPDFHDKVIHLPGGDEQLY